MPATLRSGPRFDRALGELFEIFEEREPELRVRLRELVKALLAGPAKGERAHHRMDETRCVPFIEGYVVVFLRQEGNQGDRKSVV